MGTRRRSSEFSAGPQAGRDPGQGRQPAGETSATQGEAQHPVPRMPHERDASSDAQAALEPSMARVGRLAHADVERGVADTSRSVETDAAYHRLREGAADATPPPVPPVSPPGRRASRR